MSGDKKGLAKRTLICYHLDGWPGHFPSPRCALLFRELVSSAASHFSPLAFTAGQTVKAQRDPGNKKGAAGDDCARLLEWKQLRPLLATAENQQRRRTQSGQPEGGWFRHSHDRIVEVNRHGASSHR